MDEGTTIEQIARVTHEANRAIQIIQRDPDVSPSWDEAPEWQRVSAKDGVRKAIQGATPRELHDNWSQFKESDGWVYGEVKDEEAKTHPCLVPYDQLPADQRLKDYVFQAVVKGYLQGVAGDDETIKASDGPYEGYADKDTSDYGTGEVGYATVESVALPAGITLNFYVR